VKGLKMVKSQESRVESRPDFGFRISDFGLRRCENSHGSRTENPQSAIRNPQSRRGISLTEVLISLGILTLGLLGAAALFPVGGWYMQKATIADNGSALAQAVMNDLIAQGTINPKAWYSMVPIANGNVPSHAMFPSDSKYVSPLPNVNNRRATFTRPFAEALAESLSQSMAVTSPAVIDRQFGNAFVIDPLYIAAATIPTIHENNKVAYCFPASAIRACPKSNWAYYNAEEWDTWRTTNNSECTWPIRKITFQAPGPTIIANNPVYGLPLGREMASYYFRGSDDLTTDLPSRDDRPARQNLDLADIDQDGFSDDPLSRQRVGDYSWLVSVVPTTSEARNGMVTSPGSYSYDISVVVFYKRVLPTEPAADIPAADGVNLAASYERAVSAKVISTGLNGGELLLQTFVRPDGTTADGIPGDPFQNLKTGQFILLCGPHPNSTDDAPHFALNWYQVLSIESEASPLITQPKYQRLVTVRGPQWPWQPASDLTYETLSNDLCAGIFRGAVAVHTKTMRLESTRGGAGGGMGLVPTNAQTTSQSIGPY
jgi:hypothetical protein